MPARVSVAVDHIRKTPLPSAKPPVAPRRSPKRPQKESPLAIAAAIILPLLASGGFIGWLELNRTQTKREVAEGPSVAAGPGTVVATQAEPFVNSLGMKFVPVPITGGPTDGQDVLFSIWDTRVQDYEVFAKATYHTLEKPDFEQGPTHPVVNVSWNDAQAFCAWLTERDRANGKLPANYRYRLPSDHEWSCAVGIGDREDAAKTPEEKNEKIDDAFPWGSQWPPPAGSGNYAGKN